MKNSVGWCLFILALLTSYVALTVLERHVSKGASAHEVHHRR